MNPQYLAEKMKARALGDSNPDPKTVAKKFPGFPVVSRAVPVEFPEISRVDLSKQIVSPLSTSKIFFVVRTHLYWHRAVTCRTARPRADSQQGFGWYLLLCTMYRKTSTRLAWQSKKKQGQPERNFKSWPPKIDHRYWNRSPEETFGLWLFLQAIDSRPWRVPHPSCSNRSSQVPVGTRGAPALSGTSSLCYKKTGLPRVTVHLGSQNRKMLSKTRMIGPTNIQEICWS